MLVRYSVESDWVWALVQEEGLDTVDANRALGLPDDCREYSSVRNILQNLGIRSIRLMVSPTSIPSLKISLDCCFFLSISHLSSYIVSPVAWEKCGNYTGSLSHLKSYSKE